MYIDDFLPFLKKSPFLKRENKEVKMEELFFPYDVEGYFSDYSKSHMNNRVINIFYIEPLDVYVMDEPIGKVAWYIDNVESVSAIVSHVDYQKVTRYLQVEEFENGDKRAFYPETNGFSVNDIETVEYLNLARDRISIFDRGSNEVISESVQSIIKQDTRKKIKLFEFDVSSFIDSELQRRQSHAGNTPPASDSNVTGVPDNVEMVLAPYLAGDFVLERVPLLEGPTAVMKSATVKNLAKKYGYRVVDFRAAFIDRLDLEGLSEIVDVDGNVESFNALMYNIMECTDEFLDFCEASVSELRNEIELVRDEGGSEGEIAELEKMLGYYSEKSKPAVLFFDEVTRAPQTILNALTTILNQKEFNGYQMTRSKIVTATNVPLDITDNPELEMLYGISDTEDSAINSRFQPIPVKPSDVEERWWEWATSPNDKYNGDSNVHSVLIEFLENNPNEKYNFKDVEEMYEKNPAREDLLYTTAFPNYRTWDLLSRYLYKREDFGEPNTAHLDIIEGFVGTSISNKLADFMEKKGFNILKSEPENKMDNIVEEAMIGNVPTMLITPSSMGKTARIKNVARKYGIKQENIIKINLSQQDSIDIMGPPTKVDLASYVGGHGMGDSNDELFGKDSRIGRKLKGLVKNSALPTKVTIKASKTDLAQKVRDAVENNERLVIFFDEFNRVLDKSVMTAIFEVVSDCFVGDTKIKMLGGNIKSIQEIHEEVQDGKDDVWVYSCDKNGGVKPGKVTASRKIDTNKRLVKVTLDNGREEICTEDHKWMLRDGNYRKIIDLKEGDSLMPLYDKLSSKDDGDYIDGYVMVLNNKTGDWEMVHTLVAKETDKYQFGNMTHHSDFNKLNNNPENLDCNMDRVEHLEYHGNHLEELKGKTDFEEKRLKGLREYYENPENREGILERLRNANTPEANRKSAETRSRLAEESEEYRKSMASGLIRFNKETNEDGRKTEWLKKAHREHPEKYSYINSETGKKYADEFWSLEDNHKRMSKLHKIRCDNEEFKEKMRENAIKNNSNSNIIFKQQLGKINKIVYSCLNKYGFVNEVVYEKERKNIQINYPSYKTALEKYVSKTEYNNLEDVAENYNHKIISIEFLDMKEPVYDITVDGYHNFALDSGVFVHNCRIFGVEFDPDLVTVFCAANVGDNYAGAQEFDPAFAARFNVFRKDSYEISDAIAFKKYIKEDGFNEFVIDYLENSSDEEVLEMIKQVDARTLKDSVPSQRAFKDLSTFLNDTSDESRLLRGTILFAGDKASKLYTEVGTLTDYNSLAVGAGKVKELTELVKRKLMNWSALDSDVVIKINDKEIKPEDVLPLVNGLYDDIFIQNPNTNFKDKSMELDILRQVMIGLYDADERIAKRRTDSIKTIIGDQAESFAGFFNVVSGTNMTTVDIPDLVDNTLIETFFTQKLSGMVDEDDKINAITGYYSDFYKEHGESLSLTHYQEFVKESITQLYNADGVVNLLVKITSGETTDKVIKLTEKGDIDFVKFVLGRAGFSPSDDELEELKQKTDYEGPKPKMLK